MKFTHKLDLYIFVVLQKADEIHVQARFVHLCCFANSARIANVNLREDVSNK